jgi:L-aspartate oxidase
MTDFLIIGSGIAGLYYALSVAAHGKVTIVTKRDRGESNTKYAQGGIAAVMADDDSLESHVHDTLISGDELCHEDVVRHIVKDGPGRVRQLIDWGVRFARGETTSFDLGREGGHSHRRILHAGDATGNAIESALLSQIETHPNITVLDHHVAVDLITEHQLKPWTPEQVRSDGSPTCYGAYVLNRRSGEVITVPAHVTLLATGGAGKVYLYTTNPDIASGDGMAMAYRAGARVANLEFVQFHPTCLYNPLWEREAGGKTFLISEAVRGEGGILKLKTGEAFMKKYDGRADLATRDIVARAIDSELKRSGDPCVYLDITHKPADFLKERFPTIYNTCLRFGIDITAQPIPVVPAAHYFCGGVVTDLNGCTTVGNLYAAGEVACTGLHGANRLASNSLLEAIVIANHAARHGSSLPRSKIPQLPDWNPGPATSADEQVVITQNWDEIRRLMWNYVGIVRTTKRLERAASRIRLLQDEIREYYWKTKVTSDLIELRNLAQVAELVVRCALSRQESRGLHFTLDYPEKNPQLLHDSVISRT